jgi:hypothetical protein
MRSKQRSRKARHREVLWFLLTGTGLLGGCTTPSGYKPVLPDTCEWVKFPYTWICIDPNEGNKVPEQETSSWQPLPLGSFDEAFDPPLSIADLEEAITEMKLSPWCSCRLVDVTVQ